MQDIYKKLKGMWGKFKSLNRSSNLKGGEEIKAVHVSSNIEEEYLSAFKTKSFLEFQKKSKLLIYQPPSSSFNYSNVPEFYLQPGQEAITTILENSNFSNKSKLKILLYSYFNISAEASDICNHILTSINKVKSNYKFIQRALDTTRDQSCSANHFNVLKEFNSFNLLTNPFLNHDQYNLKLMHDKHKSVLYRLKSKQKKIIRNIKAINCLKHATGVCITIACGAAATIVIIMAVHTLFGILIGPMVLSFSMKQKFNFRFLRSTVLKKLQRQLDVAAKGAYILNRDFDTMSRLVACICNEIEHNKTMIQFCLDRKDIYSFQEVVERLRKSDTEFRKKLEDLEEHIYLCLVTINRARVLVIKEMMDHFVSKVR